MGIDGNGGYWGEVTVTKKFASTRKRKNKAMHRKKTYIEEKFNLKMKLNCGLILLIILMISCQSEKKETVIPEEKTSIQQEKPKIQEAKDTMVTSDKYFNSAYNEMWRMLKGEQPLDFKRAVFLTEWAYKEGKIDYSDFSREISDITQKLGQFIQQKGVGQYKTAGNFALYEFFTRPNWMNGNGCGSNLMYFFHTP